MRRMYVSDLDGTLLRSDERTSEDTNRIINSLADQGMNMYLDSREGDIRSNPVGSPADLKQGKVFYITCIDEPEKLRPFYEKYKDRYHCVFQTDIYTKEHWLEIMPRDASKRMLRKNDHANGSVFASVETSDKKTMERKKMQ